MQKKQTFSPFFPLSAGSAASWAGGAAPSLGISRNGILLVFILLFSFTVRFSFCQRWLTHHYTGLTGLPSSNVHDIAQDHFGRMWMATRVGIACYDGVSWKHYNVSDGLPALSFAKICVDRQGRIWALADAGQGGVFVVFFDGTRWKPLNVPDKSLYQEGALTSFLLMERKGEKPVIVVGTQKAGLLWWENGEWTNFTTRSGLLSNLVNGIAVLNEKFYVATGNGLSVIKEDRTVDNRWNQFLDLPSKEIKGICIEHKDKYPDSTLNLEHSRIWLYGHRWLVCFDESKDKNVTGYVYSPVKTLFALRELYVRLQPDYRTGIYIGNHNELYYFNYKTRRSEPVTVRNGMVGEGCNGMFIDFEKNIWITSERGVTKISSRQFTSFQMIHGLLEDEVTAVLEYKPGKFVLGHNNGFTFYNGSEFQRLSITGNLHTNSLLCRVLDMQMDSRKNIWAALGGAGVVKINQQKEIQRYGKPDGLPNNARSLWVDPENNVWVGSGRGLYLRKGKGFVPVAVDKFSRPHIRKIFGDSNRLRCLASERTGIYVYEKNQWKNYRVPGEKRINNVYAIKKDSKNRLLIGTLVGLYTLSMEGETLKKFKEKDFEINRPVYFIVEDRKHRLWFGTDTGVVRWDGTREVRYSVSEGLIGQETNRAAGIIDSKGRLWIGTNRGVSIYNEVFDNHGSWNAPPKIHLLYLEVGNRKTQIEQPVRLTYKDNNIGFHFRGISFHDEKAIRFKHKLEGFDKEWLKEHYPYKQVIRYYNLPSGTYRFHLKARNSLGVWSEAVKSPGIIILKPFYNEWWFLLLVLLVIGLIFYSVFRLFLTRHSAALLEKLVEERTGQLQASEKRYRVLFEESQDVLFTSSKDGKILNINPAGVSLFGYQSKEEILDVDIPSDIYCNPADRNLFIKEIEEKGYVKDYELVFKRKHGEKITALVTATFIPGEKEESEVIRGIIRDITEKKRLQQQLMQAQKMEALGTLAGGIAHDFNNILGVITGYLELTLDDLPGDNLVRQNVEQVLIAAGRAREMVNRILTFSRISSGERKPLMLSMVIKETLKLLRSSLPATIEIRQDISAVSDIVMADPTQMQQIIMNLGTNAAHAMRKEGGLLEVGLHNIFLDEESAAAYNYITPGAYLRLEVSDTGCGIDPAIIKRIFEPYFTTKKKGEGTGMGLAVIHGIVKTHSGEITVYSEPGVGTTFYVLLPITKKPGEARTGRREAAPTGSRERILFVDDEIVLAGVVQLLLEKLGYTVVAKSSSVEALEVFRTDPNQFDLVITDLTMPHMTGIQLTKVLEDIRPDIPIILCTGFSEAITAKQVKDLGIRKLLIKPVDKTSLAKAIREALKKNEE